MEDPVVLLERILYGHPLAGLLWERQFEKIVLKYGWEKVSNWECAFVHREKGLFLSVCVDDVKLARGVSPAEPRRARYSVETQAMTSRRAGDHPPPQGSKTNGRKVAPKAATWEAVSKKEFLRDSTSWNTSATEGEEEKKEAGRRREEMEKSQASANPEDLRGTHTWGEREGEPPSPEKVSPGLGGLGGEQEARLLELRGDGGFLSNGGANYVADGVMAEISVTSASTAESMVAPAVEGLEAKAAG